MVLSNRWHWGWSLWWLGMCALLLPGCGAATPAASPPPTPAPHPPSGLERLWVVDPELLSPAEQTLVLTLQGLTATGSEAIWVEDPGMDALILAELAAEGVALEAVESVWALVAHFRAAVQGAVVYEQASDSINVATSLCGPLQAVAVDATLLPAAEAAGLEVLADVRGMDEVAALDTYGHLFPATTAPGILVELIESKAGYLRDYAVAKRAFTFYGVSEADHRRITAAAGPDLRVFGWGGDEHEWIRRVSEAGGAGIPADWSRNLSVLERIPATLPERPRPPVAPVRRGERIVAFVMSDGDNIQWMAGGFVDAPGFWASPYRGEFAMTWEMAPLLAEVAPRALAHFYRTAHWGGGSGGSDDFVTGPSGVGYAYHNFMPDRATFAARTAAAMAASDLQIATVLNSGGTMAQSEELLARPEVMGVIYKDYAPYNAQQGRIFWHAGKPAVAYRYILWAPLQANSPEGVAAAIAELPANPRNDPDSYALINVHAWSFEELGGPMAAVKATIDRLPPKTRVVTAHEFFTLLRENFGTPVGEGM